MSSPVGEDIWQDQMKEHLQMLSDVERTLISTIEWFLNQDSHQINQS